MQSGTFDEVKTMAQYIPALLTLVGTIVSALISLAISLYTTNKSHDKTQIIFQERLESLTEEVHKHNSLIERTYKLEARADVVDTRLDSLESVKK